MLASEVREDRIFLLIKIVIYSQSPGVLPYKGLMGTCGQPGYVFWDFCLKQGINFINNKLFLS